MAEKVAGHPHIANLIDAGTTSQTGIVPKCILVYEYAGVSVWSCIKRHRAPPPSVPWVQKLVQHVALGLSRMHSFNMVHGDLHPKNILVRELDGIAPVFVVADMGSAFEAGPSYHLGTIEYNAPERLMKGIIVEPRADVFSLGLVLAVVSGLQFHCGGADLSSQLKALTKQLGKPSEIELASGPAAWRKHFIDMPQIGARP